MTAFAGVPYADSESSGSVLNAQGRELERNLTAAIRTSRHSLPELDAQLGAVGSELQAGNGRAAKQLQLVMLLGVLIAVGLVVLVMLLLNARQQQDASCGEARQQTADILRTVKDGLFLLDENLVIGSGLFGRAGNLVPAQGLRRARLRDLLKNIVSEKTLATALKFVKVLWAERTNEKLVKSINPLGEVEVHLTRAGASSRRATWSSISIGCASTARSPTFWCRYPTSARAWTWRVSCRARSSRPGAGRYAARHSAHRSRAARVLPERFECGDEDDQCGAAGAGARRGRVPQEARHAVPAGALGQGRGGGLGLSSIESRAHAFEDDLKSAAGRSPICPATISCRWSSSSTTC